MVCALGIVLAGTASRSMGEAHESARSASVGRDYVCAGGLTAASATVGRAGRAAADAPGVTANGGALPRRPVALQAAPLHVEADPTSAADTYAVRSASGKRWLAASECPSPRADWWLVGVGGSSSHDSVLEVDNPRPGDALVDVDVIGPRGPVQAPGLHDVRVDSGARVRFDLAKYAPAVGDLAVHVTASRGLVTASAPERWSSGLVGHKVGDWVSAQPGASRRSTLVGLAPDAAHATVLLGNPSPREAVVALEFVGARGSFAPTRHARVNVPPGTVLPVDLDAELKAHPLALRVSSQVPVAATVRTVRGSDEAYAESASALGDFSATGVPDGTTAELVLVAGSGAEHPTVVGYDADGRQVGSQALTVPAKGATRLSLWKGTRSLVVKDGGDVTGAVVLGVRRQQVVATIALGPTAGEARVPAVRAGW